jgi:hypothetical protein
MEWTDEPATENQLNYLRQFGHISEQALTKGQALELIKDLRQHMAVATEQAVDSEEKERALHAVMLRRTVEQARAAAAADLSPENRQALAAAIRARQDFWIHTCTDPSRVKSPCMPMIALYREFGCRFEAPTHEQVQEIFDALDVALPLWDREHPDLFYQTLELNFKELVRTH